MRSLFWIRNNSIYSFHAWLEVFIIINPQIIPYNIYQGTSLPFREFWIRNPCILEHASYSKIRILFLSFNMMMNSWIHIRKSFHIWALCFQSSQCYQRANHSFSCLGYTALTTISRVTFPHPAERGILYLDSQRFCSNQINFIKTGPTTHHDENNTQGYRRSGN